MKLIILTFLYCIWSSKSFSMLSSKVTLDQNYFDDMNEMIIGPNGKWVYQSNLGGEITLWQVNKNISKMIFLVNRRSNIGQYIIRSTFSPNGRYMVIDSALKDTYFSRFGLFELYDLEKNMSVVTILTNLRNYPYRQFSWASVFCFSADTQLFAYTFDGKTIILYDLFEKTNRLIINTNSSYISTLAISNNKKILASKDSENNGLITIWDLSNGQNMTYLNATLIPDQSDLEWFITSSLIFSPDDQTLISHSTSSFDIVFWNISNSLTIRYGPWSLDPLTNDNNNRWFIVSQGLEFYLYDMKSDQSKRTIKVFDQITAMQFDPSASFLYIALQNGNILIYSVPKFNLISNFLPEKNLKITQIVLLNQSTLYVLTNNGTVFYLTVLNE
jgi:hypothetical protein